MRDRHEAPPGTGGREDDRRGPAREGKDPPGTAGGRADSPGPAGGGDEQSGPAGEGDGPAVLVVSDHPNPGKIGRHWGPLADVAGETTMVCVNADPDVASIRYRRVPAPGHRLVGVLGMFVVALGECLRGDYDAVAAISLVPYGCYALALGALFGLPTHLGVIGADVDRHAEAGYGPLVRVALGRFASVSVPGSTHRERVVAMGVPPERVSILANAIDADRFRPVERAGEPDYDVLWVGRFGPEKDPLLFVRGLAVLRDRGVDVEAAMLGGGALDDRVRRERAARGLEDRLALPGWVDDPRAYYARSATFALTSARDALPLSLLEAMACGLPSVVPDVGSVTDVARHGETALVVEEMTPATLADALETLLADDELRARLAARAPAVRESYSAAAARDDWRAILSTMGLGDRDDPGARRSAGGRAPARGRD